jgi:hypothetical protein
MTLRRDLPADHFSIFADSHPGSETSLGMRDSIHPTRSTLIYGSSSIGLSMLALVAAVIQHTRMLQRLEAPNYAYNAMRPITVTAAITLFMIGAFGVVGIFI